MCCSIWPAVFSKTITGTWEVLVDGKVHHVLWYQNRVGGSTSSVGGVAGQVFEVSVRRAMAGDEWRRDCAAVLEASRISPEAVEAEVSRRKAGMPPMPYQFLAHERTLPKPEARGNALIIPLLGSWHSIKLLNTFDTPDVLKDIDVALKPFIESVPRGAPMAAAASLLGGSAIVFLQFDIYDIVIAESASMIPNVISQIQERKRPDLNDEVFHAMERLYNAPLALCCFNSEDAGEAKPLAFAFEPSDPEHLRIYTLDGHDGGAPDLDATVNVDHTVFTGSYRNQGGGAGVRYKNQIPDHLQPYMLNTVIGQQVHRGMKNGDFVCDVKDVRAGLFLAGCEAPPMAPKETPTDFLARQPYQYNYAVRP